MKNKHYVISFFLFIMTTIILLFMVDYFFYYFYKDTSVNYKSIKNYFSSYRDEAKQEIDNKYIYDRLTERTYRKVENVNSKSDSIVLFGFSSVYGLNLKPNETVSYNLAKYTKRPIYNRAKPESSLNHMYYQLSSEDFYKIVKKPDYIIYFYTPKQIMLMNNKMDYCQHDVYYKLKDDKLLKYEKIPLYKKSYLISGINRFVFRKKYLDAYYKNEAKLFKTILIESKNEARKYWGNDFKFIIVRCANSGSILENKMFDELNKEGFVVLDLHKYIDIKDQKYNSYKSFRLNALFWKDVASILVKEFDLNQ